MGQQINGWLDFLSENLARRKGLLPITGILLILINFGLQFFPGLGLIVETDLFLHLGLIVALIGVMVAWAL
jgi:hypothetical protein